MMEELWLIADCSSGKFLKPTLDGKARFQPDSMLVELKTKTGTEWQVWKDSGWVRIEKEISPTPSPPIRSDFAVRPGAPCAKPDFRTFFKADAVRSNLSELNPEPGQVNFAGHYRILKNELLFDTRWFLLDCRTGKFEKEVLSADRAEFSAGTETLTLRDEGKFPRRLKWARSQWIETPDLERPDQKVRNVLEGTDARKLFRMLPNPAHHDRLDFESFFCERVGNAPASVCSIRLISTESSKEAHFLNTEESSWISELVADFGSALLSPRSDTRITGIHSGFCLKEKSRCEFETGTGKMNP